MANTDKATVISHHEEKVVKRQKPCDVIYSREDLPKPFLPTFCRQHHLQVDDNYSIGNASISDSKTHSTTFSAPILDCRMESPSATTPSTSRTHSPAPTSRATHGTMEQFLAGIGDQAKSSLPETSIPIRSRPSHISKCHFSSYRGDTPTQAASLSGSNATMGTITIHDGYLDADSDLEDEEFDIRLEETANIALSRCFGVSLDRLTRPVCIIDAFSDFKDQCAEILQNEESFRTIDWDNDDFDAFDVEEISIQNNEADDQAVSQVQRSTSRPQKRLIEKYGNGDGDGDGDGFDESDLDQQNGPKSRGRYKKRRVAVDYSCPFRKRNPRRFNVRDHHACANVSYQTMAKLKTHVRVQHYKPSCPHCRQQFNEGCGQLRSDHTPEACLLRREVGAHLQRQDPEDGVDTHVQRLLSSRTRGSRIENWHALWRVLFPEDQVVPSSDFEPLIEHHDAADDGYSACILNITNDVINVLCQQQGFNAWTRRLLGEAIHSRLKVLLKESKYAVYNHDETEEECLASFDLGHRSAKSSGSVGVSLPLNDTDLLSEGEMLQLPIFMPQPFPRGATPTISNKLSDAGSSSMTTVAPNILAQSVASSSSTHQIPAAPLRSETLITHGNNLAPGIPTFPQQEVSSNHPASSSLQDWEFNFSDEYLSSLIPVESPPDFVFATDPEFGFDFDEHGN